MTKLNELSKKENIKLNIIHQLWIKPFFVQKEWIKSLNNSKYGGLVTDDDFVEGVSSSLANDLSISSANKKVYTLGLKPKTAGFYHDVDNLPPTAEDILSKLKKIIEEN